MLSSLNSGVAGIRNFQAKLDVIGNNIANSNTIAYKGASTTFADAFSQTLQGGSVAGGSLQVGSGVVTSAIKTDFTRGSYQKTGKNTDLYIDGDDGFFTVKDNEGRVFATRAGDFSLKDGYLVTNQGYKLQGYTDQVPIGGAMSTLGDIRVVDDPANRPAGITPPPAAGATYANFNIDAMGKVTIHLSDGSTYNSGQVLLQKFQSPSLLKKEGSNLYSNVQEAGPLTDSAVPGTNGTGTLISGQLELSNVDLASEFAELITTQRGFQANARIITTSDEVLQEVVNLKH
jgi:flagellar hook protein FlgE